MDAGMKEVTLTQYLRPDGTPTEVRVPLADDIAAKAAGMILTCEVLMGGQVVIYGRWPEDEEEDEEMEFATNHAGPNQPDVVAARVIEKVALRRASVST
jgi:hypothetical protein